MVSMELGIVCHVSVVICAIIGTPYLDTGHQGITFAKANACLLYIRPSHRCVKHRCQSLAQPLPALPLLKAKQPQFRGLLTSAELRLATLEERRQSFLTVLGRV